MARETLVRRRCARVLHSFNAIPITEVRSEQQASERPHGVKRVTWGERVEGSKEQKRRADHVQPREQDLADELLRAVHATSPDLRKIGCYGAGLFSLVKASRKLLRLSRVTPARPDRSS